MPRVRRSTRRRGLARLALLLACVLALGAAAGATLLPASSGDGAAPGGGPADATAAGGADVRQLANGPLSAPAGAGAVDLDAGPDPVEVDFKRPPRAALLADVDTGQVLWRRAPERVVPIASLTKMMTALVAAQRLKPGDEAKINGEVLGYSGSGVGMLPKGKRVEVRALLHGLLMVSGNDAARALALRATGSQAAFVERMNEQARAWGLPCTSFASVEGLSERNTSCAADLVALAKRVLDEPRLAGIVRRRQAVVRFPIKGGKLYLNTTNPLVRSRYPGVLGVKTGYTKEAGRCLVAAAQRGGRRLVVVVLGADDPGRKAEQLLDRGFKALR